jgi:uncharacterized protein (DUF885 family)
VARTPAGGSGRVEFACSLPYSAAGRATSGGTIVGSGPLIDRRKLLALALQAAAVSALPGLTRVAGAATPANRFAGLLASFAEDIRRLSPERATTLGLDSGVRRALKSRLADASAAANARWTAQLKSMLARLAAIDRAQLSPVEQIRFDTVHHAARAGIEGTRLLVGRATHGFYGGTAPYPVTQQNGALTAVPEFLDAEHRIGTATDAAAYLVRVAALARVLDQESARLSVQASHGVMPPSFIARNALGLRTAYRRVPAEQQQLVTSLASRTQALGLAGNWQSRATRLVQTQVYPALERRIAALAKATQQAPDTAGVHRLPDGEAYY